MANKGAQSLEQFQLWNNVQCQEKKKDFERFPPQVAYYNVRFDRQIHDIPINGMKTDKIMYKIDPVYILREPRRFFLDKLVDRHFVLQAPFASTFVIIVLELPYAYMRLH